MPTFCQWVEHQYGSDPPSEFFLTSIRAGIVHHLSGLMTATLRFLAALSFTLFTSLQSKSPWSVFQYGSEILGFSPGTFTISLSKWNFFTFRSRYFFAIGVQLYLALEVTTSLSHCITKQHYSRYYALVRGYHPHWPCFPSRLSICHYNDSCESYHWSFSVFIRHY